MKQITLDFYQNIAKKKQYWIPLLVLTIGAFGFSLTCRTVGVDDLRIPYYYSADYYMISGGYWASAVLRWLVGCLDYAPFFAKFTAVLFLLADGFLLGTIFFHMNGKKDRVFPYLILSAGFLTYPLLGEIWEYYGGGLSCAMALFLNLCSLLILRTQKGRRRYVWACILTAIAVCSSLLATFVYIPLAMILLYYQYAIVSEEDHPHGKWIGKGLTYALPLVVGVIARITLQYILLKIFRTEYAPSSDVWIEPGIKSMVRTLLYNGYSYGIKGLIYFPITVFDLLTLALLVISCVRSRKMHSPVPVFICILLVVSLFTQSFIQGHALPYRHTFAFNIYVGFVFFLLAEAAEGCPKVWLRRTVAAVLLLVCWNQASTLNQVTELNNLRSDNELSLIRNLGYRLTVDYPRKPVAFIGFAPDDGHWAIDQVTADPNSLGGRILISASRMVGKLLPEDTKTVERLANVANQKYIQNSIQPSLDWHRRVPFMMRDLFSYCGYDIDVLEMEENSQLYESLWDIADEQEMEYLEIYDEGDYLIVCMGDRERWKPDSE